MSLDNKNVFSQHLLDALSIILSTSHVPDSKAVMDADVFEMQVNSVLKNIFQKEKKKRERKVCSTDK